jgi:tellurite resistance protein
LRVSASTSPNPQATTGATRLVLPKLRYLFPGWYAIVMGLTGLALAWHRAEPLMGAMATGVALVVGALAAGVFAVLAAATVLRGLYHADAWREDRLHPVRHTFVATLPVAILLLATVAVALLGPSWWADALWWTGSLSQLAATVWVLGRWWRGNQSANLKQGLPPGLAWAGVTPALFIPVVGNVLPPLAGVPLGHAEWAAAQFGIGLLFWPVVLALVLARIAVQGMFPERLLPTMFILIAPPAVSALALLQLGAPLPIAWVLWGMAVFTLLWVATQLRRLAALPFALPHWALSFPLAALTALTLRLAVPGGAMALAGVVLLALTSLVITALLLGTLRGLRDGSLLAPEPVAPIAALAP